MSNTSINAPAGTPSLLERNEQLDPLVEARYGLSLDVSQKLVEDIAGKSSNGDELEEMYHFQRGQFLTRLRNAQDAFHDREKGLRIEIEKQYAQNLPKPSDTAAKELNVILDRLLAEIPNMDDKVGPKTPYLSRTAAAVRHQIKGQEIYHYTVTKRLTDDINAVEQMMKQARPEQRNVLQQVRDMLIIYGQQDRWALLRNAVIEQREQSFTTRSMNKMLGMTTLLAGAAFFVVSGSVAVASSYKHPREIPKKMLWPLMVLGAALIPTGMLDDLFSTKQKKAIRELNLDVNGIAFKNANNRYEMEGLPWRNALEKVMKEKERSGIAKIIQKMNTQTPVTDADRERCAEELIPVETDAAAHAHLVAMLADQEATEVFYRIALMKEKDARDAALQYVEVGSREERRIAKEQLSALDPALQQQGT